MQGRAGSSYSEPVQHPSARYAERLLGLAGHAQPVTDSCPDPREDWAGSGGMHLTGRSDGPPLMATGPAVSMRGALLALARLAPDAELPGLEVLGERAAISGLSRRGSTSCGGSAKLLPARDGTVALTLARQEDIDLVPALVECDVVEPWDAVRTWLGTVTAVEARDRAVLLGLPCSVVGERAPGSPWLVSHEHPGVPAQDPLVVNLASLWAGPLCASLLGVLGCRVVKVEDPRRPDGTRRGPPAFFDLLNTGATSVALELRDPALKDLLARADIVIEGSRPRALRQVGIDASAMAAEHDTTWVSITGHGREQDRVAFGDDASAAGGLVTQGCFVGDAVADPLTGVHAALAAWAGALQGGGRLIDVPMAGVAALAAALDTGSKRWDGPVAPARARPFRGRGPALG